MTENLPYGIELSSGSRTPIIMVVVEDQPMRDALRSAIEARGWHVNTYPTGSAFFEAYRPSREICIVIDDVLPDMSGLDILRRLQSAEGVRLPAIMLSGSNDVNFAVEAMKAGASDFIEKPVDLGKLMACVDHVLEQTIDATEAVVEPLSTGAIPDIDTSHRRGVLATPDLAVALENDQFKRFLDLIPTAIIVSEMTSPERIVYANPEFEKLSGQSAAEAEGKSWHFLRGQSETGNAGPPLGAAIMGASDSIGIFWIERAGREPAMIEAYSNIIEDEDGTPVFRLAALLDIGTRDEIQRVLFQQQVDERDTRLMELQHRVKNNLQMITALIRIEARAAAGRIDTVPFDRLAGRINSIQLIYKLLSEFHHGDEIDLGVYLSEIVSSVMHSHAVEGVRLNLKVDAYPVSVNVAMPTGLVVNELLTNALKHAFVGRDGGTITLHSLADASGCRVVIADDGVGLPEGVIWPKRGKLGELIVRSLRQNARAELKVESSPGKGTRVTITFTRSASAPLPAIPDATMQRPDEATAAAERA